MKSTSTRHATPTPRSLCAAVRGGLRAAAGLSLCVGVAVPAAVFAQEPGGLEEILVTARFREENLQQTPLAITAVTGDMLEARGSTSTLDLDAFVPNAVIAPLGAGWGSTAAAFIRGIGLGDNSLSFEPGVPIYIDDVYHGRPQGAISTCSTSSAWKCCAARRARCSARTRSAARCASSRASRKGIEHGLRRPAGRRARSAQRARLVRLPDRRGQGVRARLGLVEEARRLLRHPRLRVRERRGLARARRRRHRGRHERRRAARDAARSDESGYGFPTPPTRIPRSAAFGSAACSARRTRAAASSTTSAARTCSRDASPCASSRPRPSRSTSSPT